MTVPTIRHLTSADEQLLRIATLGNVNWAEDRFTLRDVMDRPELAHYARLELARGDFGFAAEQADRAIGAGWAVLLPAADAGYGFVNAQTPELSLWVQHDARGHGVGRHLLRLLKSEARRRGLPGLSLSVEAGNFAKHLYEDEGFKHVRGRERDGVMLWTSEEG